MAAGFDPPRRFPADVAPPVSSSFVDYLSRTAPELLPGRRPLPPGMAAEGLMHATTVVAITFDGGVLMAGDRRATAGHMIANREIEKVYAADMYSLVGMAGTAGIGLEVIRLFQVELEHYEKIEGAMLSLDGKANRLATMIRNNLAAAMQGLAVVPLFAGFDLDAQEPGKAGRIFSFDVVGGVYEETDYEGIGSGSLFAKSSLKKLFKRGQTAEEAIRIAVEALYDAADDDTATGGPDTIRKIYPVVMTATAEGAQRVPNEQVAEIARSVIAARTVD
ncbi:proteasome subunit beta [Virgisporangium aurantiacum]|uniref:Proteasome subunit beta n=1 Tax=Virgisporangium aurantiacum TaxID=175570 RepID=A0A8J3ZH87_9ACTN|nr:proteasome subunit beta [Virgisporangium aurantiacum]GIJ64144.1 proteasome subunit beta [Virgisporangium aurantiacum]